MFFKLDNAASTCGCCSSIGDPPPNKEEAMSPTIDVNGFNDEDESCLLDRPSTTEDDDRGVDDVVDEVTPKLLFLLAIDERTKPQQVDVAAATTRTKRDEGARRRHGNLPIVIFIVVVFVTVRRSMQSVVGR